jgi:drug/metabolite transporter (DMT)-like permease
MNNILFAIIITLSIAIGVTTYRRVVEGDEDPKKTFGIAVLTGAIASSAVIYFSRSKPKMSSEPFVLDPPAAPAIPPAGSVPMPSA